MKKNYKINTEKNIGNVIFVVEGGRKESSGTELRLLKNIFSNILGYEVQELRRGCDEFIGHGSNSNSRVFALNLPKNQLTQLNEDSLDELFCRLKSEFKLKPEDCPIFFLYDRDYLSYKPNELRKSYVMKYTDPYANQTGEQGQLLLSYPSVESYLLSCRQEDVFNRKYRLGKDLKPEINELDFSEESISTFEELIHATVEMDNGLSYLGVEGYNLDQLETTLLAVYDEQQRMIREENKFSLLSLISMALLELGVIVEDDMINID